MSPQKAHDLIKEGSGLWLIDVRSPEEFALAHIEGAVNIPGNTLAAKRFPKQKMLVLVDNSLGQMNARKAAETLAANGYTRNFVLHGGLDAWSRAGFSVTGDVKRWELVRVQPEEVRWAQEQRVPMRMVDLRDVEERQRYPFVGGETVEGQELRGKLAKVRDSSRNDDRAKNLGAKPALLMIFPTTANAGDLYRKFLKDLPEDVRVLEGGYVAWETRKDLRPVGQPEKCGTCPGGIFRGEAR